MELRQSVVIAGKQFDPERIWSRVGDLKLAFKFSPKLCETDVLFERNRHICAV